MPSDSDPRTDDATGPPVRPDPERAGGLVWTEKTGGRLTKDERRVMRRAIVAQLVRYAGPRLRLMLGRRPTGPMPRPEAPDSRLAREAEAAAADQPAALLGHSHRSWVFGRMLAGLDGEAVDEELFYVACLLHDSGLVAAVAGEDFTLRSGRAAAAVLEPHRAVDDVRHVQDAICAHTTPGASVAVDGAEAYYLQAGAVCDIGGLRLVDLSRSFVDDVLRQHPREGLIDDLSGRIRAEAEAVPEGRFALLRRCGFVVSARFAPLPK